VSINQTKTLTLRRIRLKPDLKTFNASPQAQYQQGAALVIVLASSLLLVLLVVSVLRMQVVADKLSSLGFSIDRLDDPVSYCISLAIQQSDQLATLECSGDEQVSAQSLNLIPQQLRGYESIRRCEIQRLCSESLECDNSEEYLMNVEAEEAGNLLQIIATIRPNGCLKGTR